MGWLVKKMTTQYKKRWFYAYIYQPCTALRKDVIGVHKPDFLEEERRINGVLGGIWALSLDGFLLLFVECERWNFWEGKPWLVPCTEAQKQSEVSVMRGPGVWSSINSNSLVIKISSLKWTFRLYACGYWHNSNGTIDYHACCWWINTYCIGSLGNSPNTN